MSPSAASAHVVVVPPRCVVQHLHLHARLRPRYNCLQTTPHASLHASPHLHRVRLHSLLLRRPHARSRIITCCSLRRACNTSCGSCNTSCGAFVPPGRNGWRVELSRRPPGGARARDDFGGPPRQPRGEFRCYECNELGHLARDCRLRREGGGGGRRYSPPRGRRDDSPRGYGRDRSPPRRRDDSPRGRRGDSPRRRDDSPPRRRDDSPRRRDDSPPRRERRASPPASPPRGRRDSRSPDGRGASPAGSPPRRGRSASPRGAADRDRSRS